MIKRVEINYRGVFQKTLARRIASDLIRIAARESKVGFSNGRYSDAPERNGIPCKYFAFISPDLSEAELEAECGGKLDIDEADVSVVLDDTMFRGVEPWAWHGLRPINEKVRSGSRVIVVSQRQPAALAPLLARRPFAYHLATIPGETSFSGMWVFKDDLTHERVLGAIAAADGQVLSLEALLTYLKGRPDGERRASAAFSAYTEATQHTREITSADGMAWPHAVPTLPGWQDFEEGAAVPGVPRGWAPGPGGQTRNTQFTRGTTRSERPIVRFERCIKCTLCWLACPDGAFDVTEDGLYDVDYDYCTGCGKCAEVCPVAGCVVMTDELALQDNASPWELYREDPAAYAVWADAATAGPGRAHAYVTATAPVAPARD